jgi:hypothetical protein
MRVSAQLASRRIDDGGLETSAFCFFRSDGLQDLFSGQLRMEDIAEFSPTSENLYLFFLRWPL